MGDFPHLEWLTRHYLRQAELLGGWRSYLQAHGLANYCVVVDAREERYRLVYDIECSWYKGAHPLTFTRHQQMTKNHKRLLKTYRGKTRRKFTSLKSSAKSLDEQNIDEKWNRGRITSFTSKVFKASQACSEGLAGVFKIIISSSVDILKGGGSDAPCPFAVLGFGAIPNGEATPYSDVEYAFLVGNCDEYFTSLAMDSYFRLGNLGESPLEAFDIEELKSRKERLPLATQHLMKAGLRINGITKVSGNIPTGNGKENSQCLALTVDELMQLYKTSAESPFNEKPRNKSAMLSSTGVIYINEGTTSQLYLDFQQAKNAYEEKGAFTNRAVSEKRLESFRMNLNMYSFLPEFVKFRSPFILKTDVKVKTNIFKCATLLASSIKVCLKLHNRCSWEVFDWLTSEKMLSAENHLNMQTVLALSIYMRTSADLQQACQADTLRINPHDTTCSSQFYSIDFNLFAILGRLLIPIQQHFARLTIALPAGECSTNSPAKKPRKDLQTAVKKILTCLQINTNDDLLMAEILHFGGRYSQAKNLIRRLAGDSLDFKEVEEFLQQRNTDRHEVKKYIEMIAYLLYHTRHYSTEFHHAIEYLQHLINSTQTHKNFWKLLLAVCKQRVGDHQTARHLLDEVKTEQVQDDVCSIKAIDSFYSAGMERQEMTRDAGSMGAAYPDMATSYTLLGNVYEELKEYARGLECYTKSLEIRKGAYGAEANHPDIATSYMNIGDAYAVLEECAPSLECYFKSLEMRKAIYGAEANHADIAASYCNIGNAYEQQGEYTSALEYFTKSLEMEKVVFGAKANHPDIATSYSSIGNVYKRLGEYASALEYQTKALEMDKAEYGAEANHLHIAISHHLVGFLHKKLGQSSSSRIHLTKSREIFIYLYGPDYPEVKKIERLLRSLDESSN